MNLAVPKEVHPGEVRVALIPEHVAKLVKAGADVAIESGLGQMLRIADEKYTEAGASVVADHNQLIQNADVVLRIRKPLPEEVEQMKPGCIYISLLDPFNERELIDMFVTKNISAISMEMIPRITRAQKMDVLSSQANLAGYVAVILAAERLDKILPMMMTPAGTISPARVFIIGVGVAGLQAIATAKRLGARVEAFDTRPVVEEQVKSLGARFVKIDLGETGQTKDGYAKALTEEQLQKQREGMAKVCALSDIVITTAQLFGRKAPVIVTEDMVRGMSKGSVIVDLAAERGGNVEGTVKNEKTFVDGVTIIGYIDHPSRVPVHASQLYTKNITTFLLNMAKEGELTLNMEDEIVSATLITEGGEIKHAGLRELIEKESS